MLVVSSGVENLAAIVIELKNDLKISERERHLRMVY
jgi:hypothetical protein